MKKFFNAVRPGMHIGDGTTRALVLWIERYINVLFPDNGIEYWAEHRFGEPDAFKFDDPAPTAARQGQAAHLHVACYVRHGGEANIIEVAFFTQPNNMKYLTFAKCFGDDDESWKIAQAVSTALDSIVYCHEIPEIVDMAEKLPRKFSWMRETTLIEEVGIYATPSSLNISAPKFGLIDNKDWATEGANARFSVQAYLQDWKTVLESMGAKFSVQEDRIVHAVDLPGYTISDRAVPDCAGLYVLPPGSNPKDDRHYLGYFKSEETALAVARLHRDGRYPEVLAMFAKHGTFEKALHALQGEPGQGEAPAISSRVIVGDETTAQLFHRQRAAQLFVVITDVEVDRVLTRLQVVHPAGAAAAENFAYQMEGVGCIEAGTTIQSAYANFTVRDAQLFVKQVTQPQERTPGKVKVERPRNLVVDAVDDGGCFAGDGKEAPFVIFDVQSIIAGPYDSRAEAETEMSLVLDGGLPALNKKALDAMIAALDNKTERLLSGSEL